MKKPWIWAAGAVLIWAPSLTADDPPTMDERRDDLADRALRASTLAASPSPQALPVPASFGLKLDGSVDLGGHVFKNGVPFLHDDGGTTYCCNTAVGLNALVSLTPAPSPYNHTYGAENTAFGYQALRNTTSGFRNTANGAFALYNNTEGAKNAAMGWFALFGNTTGIENVAVGQQSLQSNSTGEENTAVGFQALFDNSTGRSNTAIGFAAMRSNQSGTFNTGIGWGALRNTTSSADSNTAIGVSAGDDIRGDFNTAVGREVGSMWTYGSYNVGFGVGAVGVAGESGVIRIGGSDKQTTTYIEGINSGYVVGDPVCITADDELGKCAAPSLAGLPTRAPRQEIETQDVLLANRNGIHLQPPGDLTEVDEAQLRLRLGLAAEEVVENYLGLVTFDEDGRPEDIRYELLATLLIEQVERQEAELSRLRRLESEVAELWSLIAHPHLSRCRDVSGRPVLASALSPPSLDRDGIDLPPAVSTRAVSSSQGAPYPVGN